MIVGTPSLCLDGWTRTEVCFHGFADLTTTRDEAVASPKFSCFGHRWLVDIYPGGDNDSDDGHVAVDLCNATNKPIKIQFGYSVRDAAGKEVVHHEPLTVELAGVGDEGNCCGEEDFCRRSTLLDALIEGGTLIIEVRMRLKAIEVHKQFIPKNPINNNILKSFMRNRPT